MYIFSDQQSIQDNYKLLMGSVVPRPIAFVTSMNEDGVTNAAPFSFYNIVSHNPPILMFSAGRDKGGEMKHTVTNIMTNQEFVVHVVDQKNVDQANHTAIDAPEGVSEVELAGLTIVPGKSVSVPRIAESKIAMECVLHQHIGLKDKKGNVSFDMVLGEVKCFYIENDLYNDGKINIEKLKPIGRLAGPGYCYLSKSFRIARPKY
jgi:flavin reductase (DIM6/NTAB) family NADH-FMN oxidoreductase RutF